MAISVFDLFTIGIGPSSSHSIGPMRAARMFVERLRDEGLLEQVAAVEVRLYGSLALTGHGHGTDKAILLGLEGATPEGIDPDEVEPRVTVIRESGQLTLDGGPTIPFHEAAHLLFLRKESLPQHPNGMRFVARAAGGPAIVSRKPGIKPEDITGATLLDCVYFSIGGGFVVDEETATADQISRDETLLPYPYRSGDDLLAFAAKSGLSVSDMTLANERSWRGEPEIRAGLLERWHVMQACVERGCRETGILPGGLKVERRAPELFEQLMGANTVSRSDPLSVMDWINLFALAVSEENAAGGRVVTAPTNGAAGIIPAVLHYYHRFTPNACDEGIVRFLLTAGAIGILYKLGASISGAEVGCQGEVGVACSMAAGGTDRGARRHGRASRDGGRDRHGAQPRAHLRSDWRPGAGAVHRAVCDGSGESRQRFADGAGERRPAPRVARPRDPYDARDGPRHALEVQRDVARRFGGGGDGVLARSGAPCDELAESPMPELAGCWHQLFRLACRFPSFFNTISPCWGLQPEPRTSPSV